MVVLVGLLKKWKQKQLLTRAISRLDDGITWFIEYESQGKEDLMTIHADSQKEALERMASRMDAPFTVTSISAV